MPRTVAPMSCLLVWTGKKMKTFSFLYISSTRNEPIEREKKFSLYCKLLKTVKAFAMISFLEIFLLFFKSAVGLMEEERHRLCKLFGLERHCKVCLHVSNTELSMAQYMIFE